MVLAGLVSLAGCPSLLEGRDVESQARRALAELTRGGVRFEVARRPVDLGHVEISEIAVDGRDPPEVLFHVIALGTFGRSRVGYYGSERLAFGRGLGRIAPPAEWLPKLHGVLEALAAADAASGVDAGVGRLAPDDPGAILSIRIDGDRAEVSALSPAGRRTASLVRSGDSWRFASGLL